MDDRPQEPAAPSSGGRSGTDWDGPSNDAPPYGPPWRRHGPWGAGPPPWWPQGEPWPPPGGWRTRRRFVRRIALLLLAFIFVLIVLEQPVEHLRPTCGLRRPAAGVAASLLSVPPGCGPLVVIVLVGGYVAWPRAAPHRGAGRRRDGGRRPGRRRRLRHARRRRAAPTRCAVWPTRSTRWPAACSSTRSSAARCWPMSPTSCARPFRSCAATSRACSTASIPRDDERLSSLLAATQRMTRLLEDLQTLSTAQAGVLQPAPRAHRPAPPGRRRRARLRAARRRTRRDPDGTGRRRAGARRRPHAPAPGARQPGGQRGALHAAGRRGRGALVARRRRRARSPWPTTAAASPPPSSPTCSSASRSRPTRRAAAWASPSPAAWSRATAASIAAQSEPARGTIITFRIPLGPPR